MRSRIMNAARLVVSALLMSVAVGARPAPQAESFRLAGVDVAVEGELSGFELSISVAASAADVEVATLRLRRSEPAAPPNLRLTWSIAANDVHGQWNTGARFNKALDPDWGPSRVSSMLARNAPVIALFGADDSNRLTYALSDALNSVEVTAGLREENARVYGVVELFRERHREVDEIEVQLRFDRRAVPFHVALGDVAAWWSTLPGFQPARVPNDARLPMYSTWYAYHQSVEAEALLREVELAKDLGYEAIIVDDGWQTLDSQRGYAFTGDWRPERIPQMREFVDGVHARGMKVLLWYSLPLVGERSQAYPRFAGKYLRYWDGQGAYVLDPRYPEVREHILTTYRDAMTEWGVDGFKLDFLGFLVANDATELVAADGRDYASVNEATDRLMTDIMEQLRALEPDVMIEFRQPYIGPLMRKYGNMFRAGDAPNAVVDNRVRTVDLRILSANTAIHSDMFMWHRDEPVEVAALQILNILFSVPQLSVRLEDIPAAHLEMVRFWTAYWRANRDTLLDGRFVPRAPLANYPVVAAHGPNATIVALYADHVVALEERQLPQRLDIVNAKPSEPVVLRVDADAGEYRFVIHDARGRETDSGRVVLGPGAHVFSVPPSGLIALARP